jgi:hypothetical protein
MKSFHFNLLWTGRISILRIAQVSRRGIFRKLLKFSPKRFLLQLSTFVVKMRLESFYTSFAYTIFDDVPRKRIFMELIQGIDKRLRILRIMDLRSVFSLMASQQANNVNYSHE